MIFSTLDPGVSAAATMQSGSNAPQTHSETHSTIADWWFAALDQLRVRIGNQRCTAEVVGVHVHALDAWIQLQFAEVPSRTLLLHMQPGAGLTDAIKAIRALMRGELAPV